MHLSDGLLFWLNAKTECSKETGDDYVKVLDEVCSYFSSVTYGTDTTLFGFVERKNIRTYIKHIDSFGL